MLKVEPITEKSDVQCSLVIHGSSLNSNNYQLLVELFLWVMLILQEAQAIT